jgi:hypothetical protein
VLPQTGWRLAISHRPLINPCDIYSSRPQPSLLLVSPTVFNCLFKPLVFLWETCCGEWPVFGSGQFSTSSRMSSAPFREVPRRFRNSAQCIVHSGQCTVHCTLSTLYSALCTVHCTQDAKHHAEQPHASAAKPLHEAVHCTEEECLL